MRRTGHQRKKTSSVEGTQKETVIIYMEEEKRNHKHQLQWVTGEEGGNLSVTVHIRTYSVPISKEKIRLYMP